MINLSIIVPIYKVEPYLRKCVDSLLNQDLPKDDYEIILVDDGSPDQCGTICEEYASKYGNIRVIHRENGGLSAARNSGIEIAQGKYIQFVDSDDYLEPNVLGRLLSKIKENNLDVLRFNYRNVDEDGKEVFPNKHPKQFVDYSNTITDGSTFLNKRFGPACYAVQFIVRTDLVRRISPFKQGIYYEDVEWTPRMLLAAGRVSSTDLKAYNYLIRQGSITKVRDPEKKKKALYDRLFVISRLQEESKELEGKRWFEGMISGMAMSVLLGAASDFWQERRDIIRQLRELHVFPLSSYNHTKAARRKIRLINICPLLFCTIVHFRESRLSNN